MSTAIASGRCTFNRLDPFSGNHHDPQSLHKYAYCHSDPVNNIDPSGTLSLSGLMTALSTLSLLQTMAVMTVIGGAIGAVFGAATSAYLHILRYQTFDGLGRAILNGAFVGMLIGTVLGAASINPVAFAIVLAFLFGANVGSTLLTLLDDSINVQTKVAVLLLLILQGWLGVRWYRSTFKFNPTVHSVEQGAGRSVSLSDQLNALKKPLKITDVKYDNFGRPSQQYIGENATVAVNPANKNIVSVWRTSSKLAAKLKQ